MKTDAQARQLADWLAATDIGLLELRMPDGVLRLGLDHASGRFLRLEADAPGVVPAATGIVATAPSVGVFLAAHPLHAAPLARIGERVTAGQPVALLQIGPLLLPVPAPSDGVVLAVVGPEGRAVGHGAALVTLRAP